MTLKPAIIILLIILTSLVYQYVCRVYMYMCLSPKLLILIIFKFNGPLLSLSMSLHSTLFTEDKRDFYAAISNCCLRRRCRKKRLWKKIISFCGPTPPPPPPEGGAVAQSVERATPGEEIPGSIPIGAARSLLVGSVSV